MQNFRNQYMQRSVKTLGCNKFIDTNNSFEFMFYTNNSIHAMFYKVHASRNKSLAVNIFHLQTFAVMPYFLISSLSIYPPIYAVLFFWFWSFFDWLSSCLGFKAPSNLYPLPRSWSISKSIFSSLCSWVRFAVVSGASILVFFFIGSSSPLDSCCLYLAIVWDHKRLASPSLSCVRHWYPISPAVICSAMFLSGCRLINLSKESLINLKPMMLL